MHMTPKPKQVSGPHGPSYCFHRLKVTLAVCLDGVEVAELPGKGLSFGTESPLPKDGLFTLFWTPVAHCFVVCWPWQGWYDCPGVGKRITLLSPGATQMQRWQAYREHCIGDIVGFETYIKIRHDFPVSSAGMSAWFVSAVPSIVSV